GPDGFDDARPFVPKDDGQRSGIELVADDQVRVADAAGHDLDQDLPFQRRVQLKVFDEERSALFPNDGSLDVHCCILVSRFGKASCCAVMYGAPTVRMDKQGYLR